MLNKLASIVFFFTQRTINSVGKVADGGECAPRNARGAAPRSEAADTGDACRPRPHVYDRLPWGSRVECKGSLPMTEQQSLEAAARKHVELLPWAVCLANEVGG